MGCGEGVVVGYGGYGGYGGYDEGYEDNLFCLSKVGTQRGVASSHEALMGVCGCACVRIYARVRV